ncbi:EAL and HDOD domain-containing protein [Heyndrickxia acidicola]|uniref:EAL domain-containing protein n=1 Tax=Heyndrickxia acidicola TaxID=209389 RepID=A0ABU6MLX1_9BACI|nr:EAL domain-containing protein [Heyndrickxia acidicola]MED1205402.1 EAL domain-containing protein [Heyndrickxia acidicola]
MEVFVARQPIFNRREEVAAYELLYREKSISTYSQFNGDQATVDVLINSFLNIGIEELSSGHPCFINFTFSLLQKKIPGYFHPGEIVVEILETIEPSSELVAICKELKRQGYKMALDDFDFQEHNPYSYELFKYVDMIKVDFVNTSALNRKRIETISKEFNLTLVAEKIETREEYLEARKLGYSLFQGFFFSQPVTIASEDVPSFFISYYQILRALFEKEPNFRLISERIENDLSLSYKLLKLINSPAFRPKRKIQSIRQAIILLGLKEIQKWIYILSLRENTGPVYRIKDEVIKLTLIRAKMAESLGEKLTGGPAPNYFLAGMFSLMETILSVPMEKILNKLSLEDDICDALCGKESIMHSVLLLIISVERADWDKTDALMLKLGLPLNSLHRIYYDACSWSEKILSEEVELIQG